MKLHALPPSPNTIKVVALAQYLGQQLEVQPINVQTGAHRTPDFLAKNPNGLTPVLEDGDFCLWESNAILFYLGRKANSPVVPTDLQGQADVWRWLCWGMGHWSGCLRPFLYERIVRVMFRGEQPDENEVKKAEELLKQFAPVLDAHLLGKQFLLGDQVTIADFSLAAPLVYAKACRMPLESYPNILAWYERVAALPGWQKAIPEMAAR